MEIVRKHWRTAVSIWIAFVFIQSLFFKLSGSPETQHIFGVLGEWMGLAVFADYGAYVIGIAELIAAGILFTKWRPWGGLLAFEIMCGAIVFHLFTPLGIVMPAFDSSGAITGDDGGTLFVMACLTWGAATAILVDDWISEKSQIRSLFSSKKT